MKYDVNILNDYIAKGLLEVQSHPILPLKIYNYSRECAWEKKWDEITSSARGLILDVEGNVIAKGFNKFLNYEEYSYEQIPWNDEVLYIQDKADGSLGIIFHYAGGWHIATRGSFTSDQALKAMEILKKNHPTYNDDLHPELTYLVEIIYPENRIVLDYAGEEKLILLSINHVDQELDWEKVVELNDEFFELISTTKVTNFDSLLINELKRENISNKEGYVYRFFPSNFRMKGKFEEYVRLHALMTKFSNVDIWKCLSTNTPIDLENVPDEFDAWVKKTIKELKFNHYRLGDQVYKVFRYHEYGKYNDEEPSPTKKAFAEWVKTRPKWEHAILFRMYEGREFDSILWKLLRPKYQKPFWQKEVEV
jgi:hypothetical protein